MKFLYGFSAEEAVEEEEAERLEAETAKREEAARLEKAKKTASRKSDPPSPPPTAPKSKTKGKELAAAAPARPSPAKPSPAKRKRQEAPEIGEIFPLGQAVVVYAGAQAEHAPMTKHGRPRPGDMVTNTGRLKANVGLVKGVVVANQVGDIVPNHISDSPDFPLTEGLIGIKVRPFNMYSTLLQYSYDILTSYLTHGLKTVCVLWGFR